MKKISVAIVAIAMLAMVGCGSNTASSTAASSTAASSTAASSTAENTADSAASAENTAMADGVYTAQMDDFRRRKFNNMARDKHGREVFLADTSYALAMAQEKFPDIRFHFTSEF